MGEREGGGKPRRRALRLAIVLVVVFVLLAIGLSVWIVFFTDAFRIDEVRITGLEHLSEEYVRQLSGVDGYANLATLPVKNLEKNLSQEPWIKRVDISRRPMGTVVMEVTERVPVAALDMGTEVFLLDGGGFVISSESRSNIGEIPTVDWNRVLPPEVGTTVQDKELRSSLKVLGGLTVELAANIKHADPFDRKGTVLMTVDDIPVYYGEPVEMEEKNRALDTILNDVRERGIPVEYIDVRVPDNPVMRQK